MKNGTRAGRTGADATAESLILQMGGDLTAAGTCLVEAYARLRGAGLLPRDAQDIEDGAKRLNLIATA